MTDKTYYHSYICEDCGEKFCGKKQKRCLICKVKKMDELVNRTKKRRYFEKRSVIL